MAGRAGRVMGVVVRMPARIREAPPPRPMSRYQATRALRDVSCIGLGAAGMALLLAIMGVIG